MVCDGDDEVARLDISRVRTRVFQRQRWRTRNGGKGGPLPTREGRGAQGNGPRRRGSRLGVLSAKPSGSPIDPRHPEISGGLRRLQRRDHRDLGFFSFPSLLEQTRKDVIMVWENDLFYAVFRSSNEAHRSFSSKVEILSVSLSQDPPRVR